MCSPNVGAPVTTALAATAAGTPIAEKGSITNPFFYLRDPHGDIVSSVSTTAANQTTRTFDPFGKPLSTTQVSGSQPVLGFQGDFTDPTTSLVDMATAPTSPPRAGSLMTWNAVIGT